MVTARDVDLIVKFPAAKSSYYSSISSSGASWRWAA